MILFDKLKNRTAKPGKVPTPPGGGDVSTGEQTASFTQDATSDFINPERGWMLRENHTSSTFANARTGDSDVSFGYAVLWSYMSGTPFNGSAGTNPFRLDNYKTSNIPASLLTELNTVFSTARTAGIKLKIRFAYNYGPTGNDTTQAWIETHIGQLAPTINANRDVIASMDAGFIGRWGEWNWDTDVTGQLVSGQAGADSEWWNEPYLSAYNAVYQKLVDEIHADIMLGFRYPRDDRGYRLFFNGAGGRTDWTTHDFEGNRFDGSAISRSGWYNDCLWSSRDHATFDFFTGATEGLLDIDAAGTAGRVTATSGETCNLGGLNSYNDIDFVLGDTAESSAIKLGGPDTLYRKFWDSMYQKWIDETPPEGGRYNEFSRRLGYRIHLNSVTVPTTVVLGSELTVSINWTNAGFGKVYNPRPVDLIFVGANGTFTTRLSSDARRALPLAGETVASEFTASAPASLVSGVYDLYLRLPDPDPLGNGLDDDVRYCIRLANSGVWSSSTGRHDLGVSVTVP